MKPNILILFLHFLDKAKLKYLAVNVNAMHERLQPISAFYIGVVSNWWLSEQCLLCLAAF
jgi:hypothetical protein